MAWYFTALIGFAICLAEYVARRMLVGTTALRTALFAERTG